MDYLIEIGTEELPAGSTGEIALNLKNLFQSQLETAGLVNLDIQLFSTPRRIAILVVGLPPKTPERKELIKGPGLAAPESAVSGFARKNGVEVSQLEKVGERYCLQQTIQAVPIGEVLESSLKAALAALSGDRWMTWGDGSYSFTRPVRWLVSLLDGTVFPLQVFGLQAGRKSRINRLLESPSGGFKYIDLASAADYAGTLRQFKVEPLREGRKDSILSQIRSLESKYNFRVEVPEELLEEVVDLLEWPVALVGSFEEAFLELPDFLTITVLKHHQRYFPCYDSVGKLMNCFVFISNCLPEAAKTVTLGNERVLRARLKDAEFFVQEDLRVPLVDRLEKLKKMTFQKELGEEKSNMKHKAERIQVIVEELAKKVQLTETEKQDLQKGASLAKCDLGSSMVFEFPELQGLVGAFVAQKQGASAAAAQMVAEQYMPLGSGKPVPATKLGALLALADKVDNLVALFSLGKIPSGSADPFALRRQTQGMLEILLSKFREEFKRLTLDSLLDDGYLALKVSRPPKEDKTDPTAFVLQRLQFVLSQSYPTALVEAVVPNVTSLQALSVNPFEIQKATEALLKIKEAKPESFLGAAQAIRRVRRILNGQTITGEANPALFREKAEEELLTSIANWEASLALQKTDFDRLTTLLVLQKPIDAFFDGVMVEDQDKAVAQNRKNLLAKLSRALEENFLVQDWDKLLAWFEGEQNPNEKSC